MLAKVAGKDTQTVVNALIKQVDDLAEACEHADRAVRSLIMTASSEDWRGWVLHVTDNDGDEIFNVPFATVLGKLH